MIPIGRPIGYTAEQQSEIDQAYTKHDEKRLREGKLKPVKRAKHELQKALNRMGTEGLSEDQKTQMASKAAEQAGAQIQGASTELSQAALSGQGFQAGEFAAAQGELGDAAAEASAQARSDAERMSQAIAAQRDAQAMAALERQQERAKENARYWLSFGIDTSKAIPEIMGAV